MKNMGDVICDTLEKLNLEDVYIGMFQRPESLAGNASSIVLIALNPPSQSAFASNKFLQRHFTYQINVESSDYYETKRLAREVEKVLLDLNFFQQSGGLDEYFEGTKRYVDARTYRGSAQLYDIEY